MVTFEIRDQRYREHDPILGVIPIKLCELFQSRSQVTRWYPLDGGVGFGRIRLSLLFRSVEIKLPPAMLGWHVGTFEFTSDTIMLHDFPRAPHRASIKLRSDGSNEKIPRSVCHAETQEDTNVMHMHLASSSTERAKMTSEIRLPVKHRYRSPVVFEIRSRQRQGTGAKSGIKAATDSASTAYAVLWLQHLVDSEDTEIDLPIWTTKHGNRLMQNYVTEQNWEVAGILDTPDASETAQPIPKEGPTEDAGKGSTTEKPPGLEDLIKVGRIRFRCRFKPGIDESHRRFTSHSNNDRESYEAWEACVDQGVRARDGPISPRRDMLTASDSGDTNNSADADADTDTTADTDSDTGTDTGTDDHRAGNDDQKDKSSSNKRSERRQLRGVMQWKPARNAVFAKDETKYALRKVKTRLGAGALEGREPDIETETGN